jgi:hypothetical protein
MNGSNLTESDETWNETLAFESQEFLLRHPAVLITDWIAFIFLLAWSVVLAHKINSFKVDDATRVGNYFFGCLPNILIKTLNISLV